MEWVSEWRVECTLGLKWGVGYGLEMEWDSRLEWVLGWEVGQE